MNVRPSLAALSSVRLRLLLDIKHLLNRCVPKKLISILVRIRTDARGSFVSFVFALILIFSVEKSLQ